jgi:type IV pilus assembly protein PilN
MRGAVVVNLASEPFRRDRPFLVLALAGVVLLAGLLAVQVAFGSIERAQRLELQASIDEVNRQLARLNAEDAALQATLREPANAEAIDYAIFLNQLITRKAISWTKLFGDLESVVPHNVRLVSVRPQVNQDNQIVLDMTVAAQTTEPVIDMLMKLESSPVFGATTVTSWLPPSQSEPLFRYRVNVRYAAQL